MNKHISKEETLGKHKSAWLYIDESVIDGEIGSVYEAMDTYAKQETIAFAEWASENGWDKHVKENEWYNRMGYVTEYTTEQLYDTFLQSKSKQI
mgnify:CR=1 FL=1